MSPRIIAVFVIITAPIIVKAQDSFFGLRFGYVESSFISQKEGPVDLSPLRSFSAAMVFSSAFDRSPFGVSIEPGYIMKGSHTDIDSLSYRFHYFTLPITFDFSPIQKIKLSAGLAGGYLVSAVNKPKGGEAKSITDVYNQRWEAAALLGASYSVTYFLDAGARYSVSFTDVSSYDPAIGRRDLANQYWQVFLLFKVAN